MFLAKLMNMQQALANNLNGGYAALLTVIVLSISGLVLTVAFLNVSLSIAKTSFSVEQSEKAKVLAYACAEKALNNIKLDALYGGSEEISLGSGNCNIFPVTAQADVYTINLTGNLSDYIWKNEIIAQRVASGSEASLLINSWKNVKDF